MTDNATTPTGTNEVSEQFNPLINVTTLVYALQALAFLIGISYIVAVVINYVKRDDVKGTWLESHFRWQIRTFWFSLLWFAIGLLTAVVVIGYAVLFANTVWVIYRIVKGWLDLNARKPMYRT